MALWAIIPVKPLNMGKSRLASVLTPEQRWQLNSNFLIHTLQTVRSIVQIQQVLVVSRDPKALAIARQHGAWTLQEDSTAHLNKALMCASVFVIKQGASAVLILPSDLPLLAPEDVLQMLEHAVAPPVVVIAPDRHDEGTNALLVAPPDLIDFQFGQVSFQRHCQAAHQAQVHLEIVKLPSLELDVDLPEDLDVIADKIFVL